MNVEFFRVMRMMQDQCIMQDTADTAIQNSPSKKESLNIPNSILEMSTNGKQQRETLPKPKPRTPDSG